MRTFIRLLAACVITVILATLPAQAAAGHGSDSLWAGQPPAALRQHTFELFARHGRPFVDPQWQLHFSNQAWYKPDPAYRDDRLTDQERLVLRGVMAQRLKLASVGDRQDRPLFQVERDILKSGKAIDWRPLAWLGAANGLCLIVFILWRKARVVALLGFVATTLLIYRGYQALSSIKSDVDIDTAYVLQGPIQTIDTQVGTTFLTLGDISYVYNGRYPFRVGEMVTLAVSSSGIVLQANGNRAPIKLK